MFRRDSKGAVTVLQMEYGKVNVMDIEMLTALSEELSRLNQDSTCGAVILTGSGKAFSAGVDLFRILDGGEAYLNSFLPVFWEAMQKLFLFPKPLVAAVNGHAIAGGCIMVCAADYRIMARGPATIGVTELLVGVPFPAVALEMFRFSVAPQFVQEAIYSGRTYGAEDALRRGMVDEVTSPEDLLARAFVAASTYGEIPGESFRITKHQLRRRIMEQAATDPLDADVHSQWSSPQVHAVVRAYLQKTVRKKD